MLYWDFGLKRWKTNGHPKKDNVYVGELRNGVPHGEGTLTSPDGEKYVGEFKDGKRWSGTFYEEYGNVEGTYTNGVWKARQGFDL